MPGHLHRSRHNHTQTETIQEADGFADHNRIQHKVLQIVWLMQQAYLPDYVFTPHNTVNRSHVLICLDDALCESMSAKHVRFSFAHLATSMLRPPACSAPLQPLHCCAMGLEQMPSMLEQQTWEKRIESVWTHHNTHTQIHTPSHTNQNTSKPDRVSIGNNCCWIKIWRYLKLKIENWRKFSHFWLSTWPCRPGHDKCTPWVKSFTQSSCAPTRDEHELWIFQKVF